MVICIHTHMHTNTHIHTHTWQTRCIVIETHNKKKLKSLAFCTFIND